MITPYINHFRPIYELRAAAFWIGRSSCCPYRDAVRVDLRARWTGLPHGALVSDLASTEFPHGDFHQMAQDAPIRSCSRRRSS